jgi:hypothetical protein
MIAAGWLEWWTAERVVALATTGQLLVLVAAALYARAQVREARELRKDEARPYVVVDFEPDRPPFMNLVVANLGRTMARNVRIETDPPLDSSVYRSGPVALAKLRLFSEGIPSLAPGKRIVLLFDQMAHRAEAELPESYRVRLTYEWDGGDPIREDLRLDLDLYRPLRRVMLGTTHDVNQTLDKIRRLLEMWSAGVERGLLVVSPEDKRRRDGEFRAWVEKEQAAEQAAAQVAGSAQAGLGRRLLRVAGRLRRRRQHMKAAESGFRENT